MENPWERFLWLSPALDLNILFESEVNPSGEVECDEDIRVDLNVSVLRFGRNPVDVIMVMDRSGSMSWGGRVDTSEAWDIVVDENTAFIADGSGGLRTADVSVPRLPSLSDQYNSAGTSYDVAFENGFAFLADSSSGMHVVNVQNPNNIFQVSTETGLGSVFGVDVLNDFVFVASTTSGVVYDITTTTYSNSNLRIGYTSSQLWLAQSFIPNVATLDGVRLYLRRYGNPSDLTVHVRETIEGSDIASVVYPAGSVRIGGYDWENIDFATSVSLTPGNTYFIVLTTTSQSTSNYYRWARRSSDSYPDGEAFQQTIPQGGDMLLRTYHYGGGLSVLDVSNKNDPVLVGNYVTDDAQDTLVQGNIVYLADGVDGLKIFDVSTPSNPSLLGEVDTTDAWKIAVSGGFAFVADQSSGLRIIDVSTPTNPILEATYNTPGLAFDVWVEGNLAFVADDSSLQVLDVSTPSAPVFVKSFATPYTYRGLFVQNNVAFLAADDYGLITIDLGIGPRIDQAKAAGSIFLDYNLWKEQDQTGLVSFSASATLDQGLTETFDDVNNALYGLIASGGTDIESGIDRATTELISGANQNPDAIKVQVLLSDGQSNEGDSEAAAQDAADEGIVIYTIAFGLDADQDELQTIADTTGGLSYFAENESALAELYIIIAEEIGELAAEGNTQTATDTNLLIPILDGTTITDFDGGIPLQIGEQNFVYFDIGTLNYQNPTWSGYYVFRFDCNNSFSCSDENYFIPPDGTVFEWKDINGVPQDPLEWDMNISILIKYRDLTLTVFGADPIASSGIWLDINAINHGFLATDTTQVEILLDDPHNGTVLNSVPVSAFACGTQEPGCGVFHELFFDVDSFQEGNLYAVINRDQTILECPNNNVVHIYCSTTESEFLVVKLWVWK
ncbi:VWA domain-containing protein [Candidatus Micrarchaeota archaeon]|nr:VWA domain-containing protein [Candidatus Micrarchaeota archaeon]MBU1930023.1 VWA domain-containing protein [Candidatus Micrarchaeota archaeon]